VGRWCQVLNTGQINCVRNFYCYIDFYNKESFYFQQEGFEHGSGIKYISTLVHILLPIDPKFPVVRDL
jgi:hypothetical protein